MATIDPGADLVQLTTARIQAQIPELRSIGGAADLARLVNARARPQPGKLPAGYVLYPADRAGENKAPVGLTVAQRVTVSLTIVLVVYKPNDPTGADALEQLDILRPKLMDALVGWDPGGAFEPLAHSRRQLQARSGAEALTTFLHELTTSWNLRR